MNGDGRVSPAAGDGFLEHRQYAVLGAGRSGLAACRLLLWREKKVRLIDEQADPNREDLHPLEGAGVDLKFGPVGEDAAKVLEGCEAVVVSPGFAYEHPLQRAAREKGLPSLGELELGWLCRGGAKIAAITGTNGKTTVTMLVEKILQDAGKRGVAAGNIGYALSDAVREAVDHLDETVFSLEVSSFQLETVREFAPEVAVILNITPDHLDRHPTMEAYAATKERIAEGQGAGDVLIVNQDDTYCLGIAQRSKARVRKFSLNRPVEDGAWLDGDLIQMTQPGQKTKRLMGMEELKMIGLHNVANAMAAACACQALGIEPKQIAETLRNFHAAPHRLQVVAEIEGVLYVDDSKATNLDAMMVGIESFSGGLYVIAGGRDKASPFESVAGRLAERVTALMLIGEAAASMEKAWGGGVECVQCGTMDRAIGEAARRAVEGDVVLLSPGCASFDQFKSYAHRGDVFAELVRGYAKTSA